MKSLFIAFCLFVGLFAFAQTKNGAKKEVFSVAGNCAMCKKNIEKAALSLPGVNSAVWNKDTKKFMVVYQPSKVNVDSIQSKIAAAGYDTPKFKGNDVAYSELEECCKYDRKQ